MPEKATPDFPPYSHYKIATLKNALLGVYCFPESLSSSFDIKDFRHPI